MRIAGSAGAKTTDTKASDTRWPEYYEAAAERPSWTSTRTAIDAFGEHPPDGPRFAVDLDCGAGQDTRELLRCTHHWWPLRLVVAVRREPSNFDGVG